MDSAGSVRRLIRRLATLAALLVLTVISTSAYLRLSQAGLGCADWPQCYGRVATPTFPPAPATSAQDYARMAHRLAATLVTLLLIALAFVCWTHRPRLTRQGRIVTAAILLALALAALGFATPGARMPAVSLGNLGGGFCMLALLGWLRLTTEPWTAPAAARSLRPWAAAGLILLVMQIALGGLVSAEFAALSCPSFPACGTSPQSAGISLTQLSPFRDLAVGPDNRIVVPPGAASLHMAHRLGALVVVCFLGWLAFKILALEGHRRMGLAVVTLLVLQVILGVSAVWFGLPLMVVVAHNGVAALLLLVLTGLNVRLRDPLASG